MSSRISLIAAFSENHVIGQGNDLPWDIPEDLEYFRSTTRGKPVVMGRKTLESIMMRRKGDVLPGRPHYVVSREGFKTDHPQVKVFASLQDAVETAKRDYPDQEIMIIGGASIYKQALDTDPPLVDRMYLTEIHATYEGDAFFPAFDQSKWREAERVDHQDRPIPFSFLIYDRK